MSIEPTLPPEMLSHILAHAGVGEGRCVSKGWRAVSLDSSISQTILEHINGYVEEHPLQGEICELIPHVTHFSDSQIPKQQRERLLLIKRIFCEIEQLAGRKEPSTLPYGLDRFRELIDWIEHQDLLTLLDRLKPWFSAVCQLPENADLKEWFRKHAHLIRKEKISLDLAGCCIRLLSPKIASLFPVISLNLDNSRLRQLPPYVVAMEQLQFLSLKGNPLEETAEREINKLRHITQIDISNTPIKNVDSQKLRTIIK
jgi:hypothetical protein